MPVQPHDGLTVLASMATPAMLLLANAMLILSTNQRLQAILQRIRETEITLAGADPAPEQIDPDVLQELLAEHAKRARSAHRALLCFYGSAGALIAAVVSVGLAGLGSETALAVALGSVFLGLALLAIGAVLLIAETWSGIRVTDRRFELALRSCREMSRRRSSGSSSG